MSGLSDIDVPVLSQMERGERFPRADDISGLELAYGPRGDWYHLTLEQRS